MAILLLIVFLVSLISSRATADPLYFIDGSGTNGKFINSSTYSSNLNLLLASLSSNASAAAGFAATTTGSISDRVYGLTLCRGDTDTATCRSCIGMAVSDIQLLCPNSKDAVIWYDDCQLRYSNQDFLHTPKIASDIQLVMFNSENVSADQLFRFEMLTTALMGNLSDLAVKKTSRLFATGETLLTAGNVIYGLVQCARDLSVADCRKCLQGTVDTITEEPLKGKKGGRALGMWCNMRYEFYKFYNGTSMLPSLPSSPSPASSASPPTSSSPPSPVSPPTRPSPPPSPASPPTSSSPPSPLSPPTRPSRPSPPPLTRNVTNSPVDSSQGGCNAVDIILAVTLSVVVAFVRIA